MSYGLPLLWYCASSCISSNSQLATPPNLRQQRKLYKNEQSILDQLPKLASIENAKSCHIRPLKIKQRGRKVMDITQSLVQAGFNDTITFLVSFLWEMLELRKQSQFCNSQPSTFPPPQFLQPQPSLCVHFQDGATTKEV